MILYFVRIPKWGILKWLKPQKINPKNTSVFWEFMELFLFCFPAIYFAFVITTKITGKKKKTMNLIKIAGQALNYDSKKELSLTDQSIDQEKPRNKFELFRIKPVKTRKKQ